MQCTDATVSACMPAFAAAVASGCHCAVVCCFIPQRLCARALQVMWLEGLIILVVIVMALAVGCTCMHVRRLLLALPTLLC